MSFEKQLELDRSKSDELLNNPYPLSADIYPKRSSGHSTIPWTTRDNPESGNFQLLELPEQERLAWRPRRRVVMGSYWIETKDATEGSPATYTIYGRINMPADIPDIMYSLSEDQKTPVQVEPSNTP